ncbi:MAG: ABC transporter permease [Anaerovoracaceae bacterium]|jgi:NitT/TauT family transport system permease protein
MITSITRSKRIKPVFIILFWVLVWEGLCLLINREIYLPSPATTFDSLKELVTQWESWVAITWSVYRTLIAIISSLVLGIGLGIICGLFRFAYDLFNPVIIVLRSTPIVSIIIIAIIWFTSSNVPIFAGFLMCFPVIFTSTVGGIRNTDRKLLEMCQVYRVPRHRVVKSVYLPSSLPHINAGMVSSLGIAWKATAAAEVLSMPRYSIGSHLFYAKTHLDPASLFAWTIIIIIISYIFEFIYVRVSGYDKTGKHM